MLSSSVVEGKTITLYKIGQVIFAQGDHANVVFYLQSGGIKESVAIDHRREAVIGVLEPGAFFGTSCLNGTEARHSTARAMEPSVVIAVTKDAMHNAIDSDPAFAKTFVAHLLRHSSKIENEKINFLFNSQETRLANLLILRARVGEGSSRLIGRDITQEMLADMIGATRPRVNVFLKRFRALGFIEYAPGGLRVNPSLLAAVQQGKIAADNQKGE